MSSPNDQRLLGMTPPEFRKMQDRELLTVAHRAGNDLNHLFQAEATGVHYVEADVWLFRDRLELRHEKTAGRVPLLWDRWSLAPGWGPRLELGSLIRAASPRTGLLLDLKGWDRQLPDRVLAAVEEHGPGRPFAVTAQTWSFLERFLDHELATVFLAVGNRRQLRMLPEALHRVGRQAVTINARLLDRTTVLALKRMASLVVPWGVTSALQLDQLVSWGVDGINADELTLLQRLLARQEG